MGYTAKNQLQLLEVFEKLLFLLGTPNLVTTKTHMSYSKLRMIVPKKSRISKLKQKNAKDRNLATNK